MILTDNHLVSQETLQGQKVNCLFSLRITKFFFAAPEIRTLGLGGGVSSLTVCVADLHKVLSSTTTRTKRKHKTNTSPESAGSGFNNPLPRVSRLLASYYFKMSTFTFVQFDMLYHLLLYCSNSNTGGTNDTDFQTTITHFSLY